MRYLHRLGTAFLTWVIVCICFALAPSFFVVVSEFPTASASERVVSDDARGFGMAVRRDHARTTRSLTAAERTGRGSSEPINNASLRPVSSRRLNSLWYTILDLQDFSLRSSAHFGTLFRPPASFLFPTTSANNLSDDASFDLFAPSIPQSVNSKILFTSNRDGCTQIYLMNIDGTGQVRLTYSGSNDDNPRWSPNGAKILFQSDRDNPATGHMDIYVMNADGSSQSRLTNDSNDDSAAVWSPDGSKIAFQSFRNGANYQIYIMNADGSGQLNVSNSAANDRQPSWSPDGTKIAFASDRNQAGFPSIYVMSANGSGQTGLTSSSTGFLDQQPSWSPDGTKLAFISTRDSTVVTWDEWILGELVVKSKLLINKEIYVMNADGSAQVRLTNVMGNDDSPAWSPDGTKIVFRTDRDRNCCDPTQQVWAMNPDGSSQVSVSDNQFGDYSASWTTSGNQSPVANAGGSYAGTATQPVNLNGGSSFDPDGTIAGYSWSFGDGTTAAGATPAHAYNAAGSYNITLTVTDNLGAQASATTTANISPANQAPRSNPGSSYNGDSGTLIQFNGSTSYDPDGAIVNYQWNFGDGTNDAGVAPLHAYASSGTYTATLTVTDNGGSSATTSTTAVITSPTNQPPVANPGGPYSAVSGTPIQFNGASSSDPDGTITSYQWEFADGSGIGVAPTHTFAAPGIHLVALTVTDNEGGKGSRSIAVNVTSAEGGGENIFTGDVDWNPTNRDSLDDPSNRRGNAVNTTTGNNNFQVVAPVVSLPGRGVNLNLNLVYNSLVWNKSSNEILFNIDHDYPAPGWNLGFGKMVMMGTAGAMIIEPDGTRHPFTGKVFRHFYPPYGAFTNGVWVEAFKGHTTDGSNIEYRAEGNVGLARYPNGTIVRYTHFTGTFHETYLYPSQITDANGNVIGISYIPNCNPIPDPNTYPRIQRIVDTVGRVISFHYDSQQRLTSITGPGLPDANGNATTQTFVRIHYKTQTLNLTGAFSNLTPRTQSTTFSAIDAIYYPATGRGYWFGGDSYSSYGMITKVTEERGMTFLAGATSDEQGTILEGSATRQQIYNYPSSPTGLNAVPSFTQLTESWDGGPTSAPVTNFSYVENSGPNERTMTITNPDETKSIQKSYNFSNLASSDPDKFKDGLMKEQQAIDAAGHLISKTILTWEKGADELPRIKQTDTTDELGQILITKYEDFGPHNSVGAVRAYDYDGTTVIRTMRNTFISYLDNDLDQGISSQYQTLPLFHPRLVNLIESTKVFEGDVSANKLASYTEVKYDQYAESLKAYTPDYLNALDLFACGEPRQPGGITGILNHAAAFNPLPNDPQTGRGGFGDQYFTRRGNATSTIRYADTFNPSAPSNPITETRTYDMAGNVIATSRACCEQTTSFLELATQYAFVVSETRGSADPNSLARVTTSAQYDLSTGLPKTRTDANGRPTTLTYFPGSLRPKEIFYPTGAVTKFEYDDIAAKVTQTTRLTANGTIANQTTKFLNGLGQVVREEALAANNAIDIVESHFDQFGRLWKQSQPHRNGDPEAWTETVYDIAGRVSEVRQPAMQIEAVPQNDASKPVTKYFYNEATRPAGASAEPGQTTRVVDPWDRWRWMRLDSSGRVAEVVEPNPDGGNGFATKYTYNTLGKLVRVEQGDQVRRFRYDALGRLTQQKLAEADATLNSAGEKVPDAEMWSEVFTYDQRSNIASHTDARGVKTIFSYQDSGGHDDALNRLQSVSYDLSRVGTSLTVLPSANVTYQYRTKSSPASLIDVTQVKQVLANGVSTEDFDYDNEGRVQERRLTFAGRSHPMTITYGYDSLGRISQTTNPEQYQPSGSATRKVVTLGYDASGRVDGLKVNGVDYASQITYNAASQITSLAIGTGVNQLTESYSYDPASGLLLEQTVQRSGTSLMSMHYDYIRYFCEMPGAMCALFPGHYWYTGQLTRVERSGSGTLQHFSYDSLGRLKNADQGQWIYKGSWQYRNDWNQTYSYDRYGNRMGVSAFSNNPAYSPVPQDGASSISHDPATNHITSAGYSYDAAGNQLTNGTGQSFVYDAAGRLAQVKDQNGLTAASYIYGASNQRLITQTGNESSTNKTYYMWEGNSVIAEYTDPSGAAMPQWSKNYIYLGGRLLATEEPNGANGEIVHYHHPDRLSTRLITNNLDTTFFQQANLPFGTPVDVETTTNPNVTTRRFTSYDRSATTNMDYAVNRTFDSRQSRFTQIDTIGMAAANLSDPQSLNMYSYVGNDPINRVDPDGQFWGALFRLIAGLFHNLRPNVINGSFAYGNHPPISVSFTTNFQNIGVGYGGIGIPLRSGGKWITEMIRPKKNLCDYLVSKMWDLYKHHDNEVGSNFRGDKRGRAITNCYMYAENVLIYAYSQIGRPDVVARIKKGWTDTRGLGQFGPGLAQYLVSLGWSSYYWNPDVRNPADGLSYHSAEYQQYKAGRSYYGYVPVQNFVINYRLTNPGNNDMSAYSEFAKFRFGFGLVMGGGHNFLYSTGQTFEVHWGNEGPGQGPQELYERKDFYSWEYQSGLLLVPPDCK